MLKWHQKMPTGVFYKAMTISLEITQQVHPLQSSFYRRSVDATLKCMEFISLPARSALPHRILRGLTAWLTPAAPLAFGTLFAIGCASPGPPRAPSLNLPQPVSDLAASRTGDNVELRFTLPHLSTDKLPLYEPHHQRTTLQGHICRELARGRCTDVATINATLTATDHTPFTWHETLPADLTAGSPRLLRYRVEFLSPHGKSAGLSNPGFVAAGSAPAPVQGLSATGTRAGTLLQWSPSATQGDVLLQRISLAPPTAKAGKQNPDLWLNSNASANRTLDSTVTAGEPYRYTAVRRITLTLDGHSIELRSELSAPIDFTLHPVYPPAAPTGLAAAGFTPPDQGAHYAIDLIWQPVSDADSSATLAAPLAGYNVYREPLSPSGPRTRLTATPTPEPSFHDPTPDPTTRYSYSITAIDGNGNESKAATIQVEPSPQ